MKRNYKWSVVGMLWLVCVFNYGDRQAFFAVFPKLKSEFGLSSVQIGLIGSAFAWAYALGSPIAGFIGDRIGRKALILGGCAFWSAATALTGLCSRVWQFVGIRALTGAGETFYFPAALSLMGDYHGRRTRSLAFSLHQSGVYAGTIGGSWAGAWLAERFGWRAGFGLFGAAGMLLVLFLQRFLREPRRGAAEAAGDPRAPAPLAAGETLRALMAKPTAWVLMLAFVCANFVATIFLAWMPTLLVEKFHMSLTHAGFYGTAFIGIASMLSVPVGGAWADRAALRSPGGRILVQAAGLLAGAVFVALVGLTPDQETRILSMTALQGIVRLQHLCLPLRCGRTAGAGKRGRPDEHGRLDRGRPRPALGGICHPVRPARIGYRRQHGRGDRAWGRPLCGGRRGPPLRRGGAGATRRGRTREHLRRGRDKNLLTLNSP
jgi:MFS family permease